VARGSRSELGVGRAIGRGVTRSVGLGVASAVALGLALIRDFWQVR
jgi:hypothetical protein